MLISVLACAVFYFIIPLLKFACKGLKPWPSPLFPQIFIPRAVGFYFAVLTSFLLNLYFRKFNIIDLETERLATSSLYRNDPVSVVLLPNKMHNFLYYFILPLGVKRVAYLLFSYFIFHFFFTYRYIMFKPKKYFFTKFKFPYFISLVLLTFMHRFLYVLIFKNFVRTYEKYFIA